MVEFQLLVSLEIPATDKRLTGMRPVDTAMIAAWLSDCIVKKDKYIGYSVEVIKP